MAINIREILHPSDSDSIKFEKINYNFDQILANGGGPRGQKGQKGQLGNSGLTGEKGIKGDQGIQGLKGEIGTTNTPWFSIDPSGNTDFKILKPKRLGLQYTPVIYLGDDLFDESTSSFGIDSGLNAKLNIKKDSNAFDNYVTLIDDVSDQKIVLTSTYNSASQITRFAIQNAFGATNIKFAISVDDVEIAAQNEIAIVGTNGVKLQSGGTSDIKLETLGTGKLDVDANSEFKGYVRLNNSTDPISPVAGMIRYNSSNNKFEGYFSSNEWKELCTECGSAVPNSIIINGGDINANQDGSPVNNNSVVISGGDINANQDGSPYGENTPTPTPTPTPTLEETGTIVIKENGTGNIVTEYSLDDFAGGPGSDSVSLTYNHSGGSVNEDLPIVLAKDNDISVSFVHGTWTGGITYGGMTIQSISPGAEFPVGKNLDDLIIQNPHDINATVTLTGSLVEGYSGGKGENG